MKKCCKVGLGSSTWMFLMIAMMLMMLLMMMMRRMMICIWCQCGSICVSVSPMPSLHYTSVHCTLLKQSHNWKLFIIMMMRRIAIRMIIDWVPKYVDAEPSWAPKAQSEAERHPQILSTQQSMQAQLAKGWPKSGDDDDGSNLKVRLRPPSPPPSPRMLNSRPPRDQLGGSGAQISSLEPVCLFVHKKIPKLFDGFHAYQTSGARWLEHRRPAGLKCQWCNPHSSMTCWVSYWWCCIMIMRMRMTTMMWQW